MRTESKTRTGVYAYKELIAFLLFSGFCALEALGKGALNEFGNIEFWLFIMGVILLVAAVELKANKRVILAMLALMTVGNLVHACMEVYYFHSDGDGGNVFSYRGVNKDYFLALAAILAVMILYPKLHRLLSSDVAIALMAAATFVMYGILIVFGRGDGGTKAWFHDIQLTEPVKLLFIFVIAGLLTKRQSMKRALLAVLYMAGNAVCLAMISELGTLIVMLFVFLIFLFVVPNKLRWLAVFLMAGAVGFLVLSFMGSRLYTEAMEQSAPEVFAKTFADDMGSVTDDKGNMLSGVEALCQMIDKRLAAAEVSEGDSEAVIAEKQALADAFTPIRTQLADGSLTQSDFAGGTEEGLAALTVLCGDSSFRQDFIQTFCESRFYGGSTINTLYESSGSGILHHIKGAVLKVYNKAMERFMIPFSSALSAIPLMPQSFTDQLQGLKSADLSYQTNQAASAMRIGGLTGAGNHEFIYVIYMESDMIFSEIVSFFGFAMGMFVIMMYMVMFREGIRIQQGMSAAPFHQGVALGISLMLLIQALVIIAGNMGLFPLTGITLPFVADGGMSMLVCAVKLGILVTISFTAIDEQTGLADAVFKWAMKATGIFVREKTVHAGESIEGLTKNVSRSMSDSLKKIREEAAEHGDMEDSIEEDDGLEDDWPADEGDWSEADDDWSADERPKKGQRDAEDWDDIDAGSDADRDVYDDDRPDADRDVYDDDGPDADRDVYGDDGPDADKNADGDDEALYDGDETLYDDVDDEALYDDEVVDDPGEAGAGDSLSGIIRRLKPGAGAGRSLGELEGEADGKSERRRRMPEQEEPAARKPKGETGRKPKDETGRRTRAEQLQQDEPAEETRRKALRQDEPAEETRRKAPLRQPKGGRRQTVFDDWEAEWDEEDDDGL